MKIKTQLLRHLLYGITSEELSRFLKESRNKLIRAKEKAQNLPSNYDKAIIFILSFQDSAKDIFFEWIVSNLSEENDSPLTESVEKLETLFEEESGSDEELKKLYRAILIGLVNNGNEEELNKTLNRLNLLLAGGSDKSKSDESSVFSSQVRLLDIFCHIALGETIENGQLLDEKMVQYVKGIDAIRHEQLEKLDEVLKVFENDPLHYLPLKRSRDKLETQLAQAKGILHGLIFSSSIAIDNEIEAADVEWICRCNNSKSTTSFLDALGYVRGREAILLTEDDLCELLPDEGKIIVFPNKTVGHLPQMDEIGVWKVEPLDTDQRIKFKAIARSREIYEVLSIPFSSNEPDNVRYWLQQNSSTLSNKIIFLLNDNILVKPVRDSLDLKRINFNEPFNLWRSLPAFKAWGKKLVLSPLPTSEGAYDCGEIGVVLKKLLRLAIDQEKWPKMTKEQIQSFVQFVTDDAKQLEKWQANRIRNTLTTSSEIIAEIREITGLLLQHGAVKAELEDSKNKILDDFQQGQTRLKSEIHSLNEQKQQIKGEIESARRESRQITAALSQAIFKSFEDAKEKGVALLADTAVFQALLQNRNRESSVTVSEPVQTVDSTKASDKFDIQSFEKLDSSFEETLKLYGFSRATAKIWNDLAALSIKHQFILSFKGFAANYIAQACASNSSLETFVGIETLTPNYSGDDLRTLFQVDMNSRALIINSINHVPFDVWAPKLEQLVLSSWLGKKPQTNAIFATLSDSETSFPVTIRYSLLGPIFDLENPNPESAYMPELYEALVDLKDSSNGSLPKIWVQKIIDLIDDARALRPDDSQRMLEYIQHLFIAPEVLRQIQQPK